jgi:hypothetical protein
MTPVEHKFAGSIEVQSVAGSAGRGSRCRPRESVPTVARRVKLPCVQNCYLGDGTRSGGYADQAAGKRISVKNAPKTVLY